MPDFRELFTSPDFAAYQAAVVDEFVDFLGVQISKGISSDRMATAYEVIRRVLEIPGKLKSKPEIERRLQAAVTARLVMIPAELMRKEMQRNEKG